MKKNLRVQHIWQKGLAICDPTILVKGPSDWGSQTVGISSVMSFVWKGSRPPLENISCETCRNKVAEILAKDQKQREENGPYSRTNPAPFDTPIGTLRLSLRTINCFDAEGIFTIADVLEKFQDELLRINNFGKGSLQEVQSALDEVGRNHSQFCEEAYRFNRFHKDSK